jgi:hypothetical protein
VCFRQESGQLDPLLTVHDVVLSYNNIEANLNEAQRRHFRIRLLAGTAQQFSIFNKVPVFEMFLQNEFNNVQPIP